MSPYEIAALGTSDVLTRPIAVARAPGPADPEGWRNQNLRERTRLFERALDSLWLAYQPIVARSRPGAPPFAYEALARNHEPALADPLELLGLAISVGRVGDLGQVVHALARAALRERPELTLFVNIDIEELIGPLGRGEDPLTEFATRVVLEVTERAPISALPEVRERSAALREAGFRFAIDDLGGGYAGLSSLALMDPDFVKVDQALVRDADTKPVKGKIVGSLVALARQLGIACIVEGVETEGERQALEALGCDLMQGYLFGRPGSL